MTANFSLSHISPSWLLISMMLLAFLPLFLGLMTSYVKVSIILSILKNSFGLQQLPGFVAELGLATVITTLSILPVGRHVYQKLEELDYKKFKNSLTTNQINDIKTAFIPWFDFLKKNTGKKELFTIQELTKDELTTKESSENQNHQEVESLTNKDVSVFEILPAFLLTELREGIKIGLSILIPFLIIDIAVANILTVLGVSLLSPQLLSLPIKLSLFMAIDGWTLLVKGIVNSYQ